MRRNVLLILLCSALSCAAEVRMTGETNRPQNSMFKAGDPVSLEFEVSGLKAEEALTLDVNVVDQNDRTIRRVSVPVKGDLRGRWKGSVPAPNEALGFYRARVRLSNGVTTPKTGSRPAGSIPYAVLPDPQKRKVYPPSETFFGLHGQSAGMIPWFGARWTGGRVVMDDKDAARINSEYRKRSWTLYQCATLATPFQYNFPDREFLKRHTNGKVFTDSDGEAMFREFYRKLAVHGKGQKRDNDVLRYQPMWEPDLTHTDEEILKLHKVAFEGIHAGDPSARVLGPCFSTISRESLARQERLFEKGLLNFLDELSIHPYIQYPVEQNGLVENVRRLRELVRRYAKGREIPIRANESGYKAVSTVEQELIQMHGQVCASLIMLGEGFASNEPFYGYDHDGAGTGDYGLCYNLTLPDRVWAPQRVAPRPAFAALAAASFLLEGHRPTGAIEYLGDTVLGYSYADREDHCVIALWDFGGNNPEVELPVGRAEIETADMMGNRRRVRTVDGLLRLKLSESPVYVIGAAPELWGKHAVKKIRPDRASLDGVVGNTVTVSGTVLADGELQLVFSRSMKRNPMRLPVRKNGRFSFAVPVPRDLKNGSYPMTLKLLDRGRLVAAAGVLLEAMAPVRVQEVCPMFENGVPGLSVVLSNRTGGGIGGWLETRIEGAPEARKRIPFTLPAGETQRLRARFEGLDVNPFRVVNPELRVLLDTGYSFETRASMNFLPAVYLPGVGEGGDFSKWRNPVRYAVDPVPVRSPHFHSGPEDLRAAIAFGWNERFLLFDAEVIDDVVLQPFRGWKIWAGDSLQFGFARKRTTPPTANEFGDRCELAFSEINFALTSKGPEANRTFSFDADRFPVEDVPASELPRKISVERRPDGKSVIRYQIAVPWRFLNLETVREGHIVYWAGMVNDRDEAKQSDVSALGIFQLKQAPPREFGMITLVR